MKILSFSRTLPRHFKVRFVAAASQAKLVVGQTFHCTQHAAAFAPIIERMPNDSPIHLTTGNAVDTSIFTFWNCERSGAGKSSKGDRKSRS